MKKIWSISGLICLLLCTIEVAAQLPSTDLFLVELDSENSINQVKYLSAFNPNGYNNQAVFISDNEVLLSSNIDVEQTDILKLNLAANTYKRLTSTIESEYSPRCDDFDNFTVVRVEQDGSTQSLWEYPMSLLSKGNRMMDKLNNIGYYKMLPNLKVALFLLEDSMNLHVGSLRSGKSEQVARNIGRCLQSTKTGELVYIAKFSDKANMLMKYNSINETSTSIAAGFEDREDFVLFGAREDILIAKGSKIYKLNQNSKEWQVFLDLGTFGISNISRIDARNNRFLIVNTKSN